MSIPPAIFHDPVNLIARLPTLMQKYDEIIKITDSQNPEFDLVWSIEEWMRRQLYIITAEEYGLRRYERLLGITPMDGESFTARRNHILVRWNQQTPYTMRFLIGFLEMLMGDDFEIIPNFSEYKMDIRTYVLDLSILSDLLFIIRYIIPANMGVNITKLFQPVRATTQSNLTFTGLLMLTFKMKNPTAPKITLNGNRLLDGAWLLNGAGVHSINLTSFRAQATIKNPQKPISTHALNMGIFNLRTRNQLNSATLTTARPWTLNGEFTLDGGISAGGILTLENIMLKEVL